MSHGKLAALSNRVRLLDKNVRDLHQAQFGLDAAAICLREALPTRKAQGARTGQRLHELRHPRVAGESAASEAAGLSSVAMIRGVDPNRPRLLL